ncbi:bifunctional folylpolyglutamate synthase/dihydrofolate synthase [Paradevosia shaoguanensis]|uniref:tetrahydrofolate synthase n=1 Tax=Paradevosia shaoguanensis TaxID=1335043 RepID=A0AA41QK33_9HYPH|nr:folylpolyglutamate synthase/dihydrofolate synthase family protein [Paradevosia shaoguanensis]MCF1741144.1 bifunctional folylpolyglutamate synthase/dihydrofolate synthase [Paradevosia shaoguanensis]MCI0125627.1 bifunctional folylpolyglutamate synthase/dihydrofolate synthase [Paradevosia shaoguanensis]
MSRTDAILSRLLALHPKLIDLTLDRILRLLDDLGRPQDRLPPVIHVAGTNGKGSTVANLRAMLEASGKKVHVYTSPHLVHFRERIRLAGKLVSNRQLNAALEHCERVNGGKAITYFEITTAVALYLFAEEPADFLLLEVGMGGRFDATNVVEHPLGTIITPVSVDHIEYLGSKVAGIAAEKAGILKRGAKAVIARQTDEGLAAIESEARKLGVTPFVAGQDFEGFEQNGRLVYQDNDGLLDLPRPRLAGTHQIGNAATAIAAVRHFGLPVSDADIAKGLQTVEWPGRLSPIKGKLSALLSPGQELWLDGGHNEAGGGVLADSLRQMNARAPKPLVLIMGTFANKDATGFLRHFGDEPVAVFTVPIPGDRAAWKASDLAEVARGLGLKAGPKRSVKSALEAAAEVKGARVVICGSLHLAGNVLALNGTPPV